MLNMTKINEALNNTNRKLEAMDKLTFSGLSSALAVLSPQEIVQYQEVKSIAQMEQKIDLEVALWIYRTVGRWATSPLADKVIITQLIGLWTGAIHR